MHARLRELRARYLFWLAHFCHTPPPQVGGLKLADFALLLDGIDVMLTPRPQGVA